MLDDAEIDIVGNCFSLNFSGDSEVYYQRPTTPPSLSFLAGQNLDSPDWSDRRRNHHIAWLPHNELGDLSSMIDEFDKIPLTSLSPQESKETRDEYGWSTTEKNRLKSGIELFDRNVSQLAQFVGTKKSSEISHYLHHHQQLYMEDNVQIEPANLTDSFLTPDAFGEKTLLVDEEIPACMEEEVISAMISTTSRSSSDFSDYEDVSSQNKTLSKSSKRAIVDSKNYLLLTGSKRKKNKSITTKTKMKLSKINNSLREAKKFKTDVNKEENDEKSDINYIKSCQATPISFNGEPMVKLQYSDCDDEVDIEVDDENDTFSSPPPTPNVTSVALPLASINLSKLSKKVLRLLKEEETPTGETVLDPKFIDELEKCIHADFFFGNLTKTPQHYLKMRNRILEEWTRCRPNYLSKDNIVTTFKNCRDMNHFLLIHDYLEQIGAINFGCEQTIYKRPLMRMINSIVDKNIARKCNTSEKKSLSPSSRSKRSGIKLIDCKPFSTRNPANFEVHLTLSTLLLMDLHAHISQIEVMGLVGGYWNPALGKLTVTRYVPCKNISQSEVHCEMCPISQNWAANTIRDEGLEVLGWFHSHPTFASKPSEQDLETQLQLQQWSGGGKPCVGFILTPFGVPSVASPYTCLMVRRDGITDRLIPYKFEVRLLAENFDGETFLERAGEVYSFDFSCDNVKRINFNDAYFLNKSLTHREKFVSSIERRLDEVLKLHKMTVNAIVARLSEICC